MIFSHRSVLAICTVGALAGLSPSQSRNVTLEGSYNPGEETNDIWGYTDPNTGKEYALLLTRNRAFVIDATVPASLVVRGSFSRTLSGWSASTWRDARTFGHYMYVVTEGGGGMQIIDLANPDSPQFVRTHTIPGRSWNNSHNISIDVEAGICYAVGTSGGVHVMDLNANPTNPTYLTSYTAEYVHDMQAQDGLAYLAEYNRRTFRILDVSGLPALPVVGSRFLNAAHTAWPTRDAQFVVGTSETYDAGITIFDTSNKSAPFPVATWKTGSSSAVVHNAFLLDRVVHMSYYSEGYRAVDLSDPSQPVEVGYYDTHPSTSGYDGSWGCYPFQPSGHVYMSDRTYGLVVLKPALTSKHYGVASPGSGGVAPELHTFGAAYLGNSRFGLEVEDAPAATQAFFLVGISPLNLSFGGLTLLVDTTVGAVLSGTTDAGGHGSIPVPVPTDTNLIGQVLHAQCFVQDAGGPLGLAATAGLEFHLFQR